jgi:hypothetical protein
MICNFCKKNKKSTLHPNCKYCNKCKLFLRKKPRHNLSNNQQKIVDKYAGKITRKQICAKARCSETSLKRYADEKGYDLKSFAIHKRNHETVKKVLDFYKTHTLPETQKKFKNIRVRSITEHYGDNVKQTKWVDAEIIKVVKMAGLLSLEKQAFLLKRLNSNAGGIRSFWSKKQNAKAKNINGLPKGIAYDLVKKDIPFITTDFGSGTRNTRRLCLWVDIANNLREDLDDHIKQAIFAMAKFQKWLHGRNFRVSINNILEAGNDHKRTAKNQR